MVFEGLEGTDGAVINTGLINASLGGNVTLLGKEVENRGHGHLSLRRPDPRPVPAAIRYNELVDQTLADRNAAIALENVERRRRVRLTIRRAGS